MKGINTLADPGGTTSVPPPNRINFFRFRICFRRKVYALEVGAPPTGNPGSATETIDVLFFHCFQQVFNIVLKSFLTLFLTGPAGRDAVENNESNNKIRNGEKTLIYRI